MDEARRTRWESQWEWPLTILAAAFLGAYAWPILDPDLSDTMRRTLFWFAWVTWLLFIVDYGVRLQLSLDRRRFIRSSIFDLVVIALPILRPLRVLRLLMLLRVLDRRVGTSMRGKVTVYLVGSTALVLFCAALAMLDAERQNARATITEFGDALWWSITTVTTVGYGDHYPVTGEGRFIAGLLMLGGIALLGMVTATLASWLIDRVREVEEATEIVPRQQVTEISQEIAELRTELRAIHETVRGPSSPVTHDRHI